MMETCLSKSVDLSAMGRGSLNLISDLHVSPNFATNTKWLIAIDSIYLEEKEDRMIRYLAPVAIYCSHSKMTDNVRDRGLNILSIMPGDITKTTVRMFTNSPPNYYPFQTNQGTTVEFTAKSVSGQLFTDAWLRNIDTLIITIILKQQRI